MQTVQIPQFGSLSIRFISQYFLSEEINQIVAFDISPYLNTQYIYMYIYIYKQSWASYFHKATFVDLIRWIGHNKRWKKITVHGRSWVSEGRKLSVNGRFCGRKRWKLSAANERNSEVFPLFFWRKKIRLKIETLSVDMAI